MADNRYIVGYAKLGTSSCKKCKQKIAKGSLRIGKVTSNPFSEDGGDMKQWFHPSCIFETFVKARATTKKIQDPDDFEEGFYKLEQEDKDEIKRLTEQLTSTRILNFFKDNFNYKTKKVSYDEYIKEAYPS